MQATTELLVDGESAPEILVVTLADAALRAVRAALVRAHPAAAVSGRAQWLDESDQLAVQILPLATELTELLRRYDASLRERRDGLDDDAGELGF